MDAFDYVRPETMDDALREGAREGAHYIGGGTNLIDLLKGGVEHATRIVDVTRLPLADIETTSAGGLRIGALVRNTDAACHPDVRTRYPLLSQAFLAGASQQLRNMATVGGNLLQRTRCHYFVDTGFEACNKRRPGSGCAAIDGHNRIHAVLGGSDRCIAVQPSDMSVALAALDAAVHVRGADGERRIAIEDFHRLPGDTPWRETALEPGELIVAVELPKRGFAAHSHYLKLRDRASFAFALVSVAAALDVADGVIREARIALGGVGTKPWRARDTERGLKGLRLDDADRLLAAAKTVMADAKPRRGNAFKIELAPRAIVRAVRIAAGSVT